MDRSSQDAKLNPSRVASNDAIFFFGLAGFLVFVPLFWGGIGPLPLLVMELVALVLLAGWVWWPSPTGSLPSWPARFFLLLLVLLPLAQLLPVPLTLWSSLPGRAFYADALRQAGVSGADFGWRAISLIPSNTESAWLALLPPLAVFLVVLGLRDQSLLVLVRVFLGIATGEALLGLIQYGGGPGSAFRLGNDLMGDSAMGTYINRNHLAGLLEMALPLALGQLSATVGQSPRRYISQRQRGLRRWVARLGAARFNQAMLFGAVALAILLGLIFTRSRSGISLAMLGILLCTLLFSNRLGGRNVYGLLGTFTAIGVGLAGLIGLVPVLDRFTLQDPLADGRWLIFDATVQATGLFFPLGSGAGTFEEVMRRFHPINFPGVTINRAHNDYLEWLLEAGLGAALLIAAWLAFYLRQWGRIWIRGEWTLFRFAQSGAGIALLLLILHGLTDFNLRIPANAVFAAFLAAVFFHRGAMEKQRPMRRRQSPEDDGGSSSPPPLSPPIPPENQINPFAS
jgi:O-antigen ligase